TKPLTKPLTKPSTKHFGNTELELDSELDTDTELETDKEHSPAEKKQDIPYKEIINYFNSVLDTNYKSSSAKTKSLIKARWNEGFRLDDFKIVINKKTAEWMGDKKCEKWLRPYTLFSNKFENYLNQLSDDDSKDEEKIMKKYLEDGLVLTDEEREKLGLNKPKKNMWGTEEE
ncbi:MAG: conserved phage C-terminal domain-containing protein, partial [Candidatus Lokiarchaeota archaeon]|nr:conserved phage C-terminal domain-containing protein [Candidatus Lokiarchaeota archaeon]